MATFKRTLSLAVCLALVSANAVSAENPDWYPGPTFEVSADAEALNTFVGQVEPRGANQLTGLITMTENGFKVNAQNQQIQDITIQYGPENSTDPVLIGSLGPGQVKYIQDPTMEGGLVDGINVQFIARPGYHFVSVSFGVACNAYGRYPDAFYVDGLGSSTVGSGSITIDSLVKFSEGKFEATKIYTPQITIVPNNAGTGTAFRFGVDNFQYVLEQD